MPSHRAKQRIRRILFWIAFPAFLILLAADITSTRYAVGWWDESGRGLGGFSIAAGRFLLGWDFHPRPPGSGPIVMRGPTGPHHFPFSWTFSLIRHAGGATFLFIPLWSALLATAAVAAVLRSSIRRSAKRLHGCCVMCGYDLRGLPPGELCPECGRNTLKASTTVH
jgi:hypothetical protein